MLGNKSFQFTCKPYIISSASIVGSKEADGPMGKLFDKAGYDDMFGAQNWEDAESSLQKEALEIALGKAKLAKDNLQLVFAGDLLGQSIASSFGLSGYQVPHVGLYGACSTCGLSLAMGGMAVAGAFAQKAACITSSHFASAEKEFRFPLAYGNQRPKSATWTVTGSGAFILSAQPGEKVRAVMEGVTIGKIVDYGIKDSMNMGACMAPRRRIPSDRVWKISAGRPGIMIRLSPVIWEWWDRSFSLTCFRRCRLILPDSIWTAV